VGCKTQTLEYPKADHFCLIWGPSKWTKALRFGEIRLDKLAERWYNAPMDKFYGCVFENGKQVDIDLGNNLLDAILKAKELNIVFIMDYNDEIIASFARIEWY
jgi:hypothetical protein